MNIKDIGAKFYSKKRVSTAICIQGAFTGVIIAYLNSNDTNVVLSIFIGVIVGLFINMAIVPKIWLYRLRQALRSIEKDEDEN